MSNISPKNSIILLQIRLVFCVVVQFPVMGSPACNDKYKILYLDQYQPIKKTKGYMGQLYSSSTRQEKCFVVITTRKIKKYLSYQDEYPLQYVFFFKIFRFIWIWRHFSLSLGLISPPPPPPLPIMRSSEIA